MKKIKILTLILLVITCVGCKKDNEKENENGGENKVENKINGHEYVDLGLPSGLKWATCNIGAASPSDYGNYYAWGETETKSVYTIGNCITYEVEMSDISWKSEYDAAVANWGKPWRTPKSINFQELINECTWVWTTQDGHDGYKVVGPNGNHIFLPVAGFFVTSLTTAGETGFYWSSTPKEESLTGAYYLGLTNNYHGVGHITRFNGQTIRPIAN